MLGNIGTSKFSRLWAVVFVDLSDFKVEEAVFLLDLDASVLGECVEGFLGGFSRLMCDIWLPNATLDRVDLGGIFIGFGIVL